MNDFLRMAPEDFFESHGVFVPIAPARYLRRFLTLREVLSAEATGHRWWRRLPKTCKRWIEESLGRLGLAMGMTDAEACAAFAPPLPPLPSRDVEAEIERLRNALVLLCNAIPSHSLVGGESVLREINEVLNPAED